MDGTPDHPTLSRAEGTCWHQRNPRQSQAPSYQPSSPTKKHRASVDRTDSQRGKYVVMKTKENFQGSSEVSNTKAKVRIAVRTHLPAEFDTGSQRLPPPGPHSPGFPFAWIWPPCPSHSAPRAAAAHPAPQAHSWASAQGGHTHSQLPVNFLHPSPTPDPNLHLLELSTSLTHRYLETTRSKLIRCGQISSSSKWQTQPPASDHGQPFLSLSLLQSPV